MMLILTENEISRLSPQLKAELLREVLGSMPGGQESEDVLDADDPSALPVAERYIHPPQQPVADDVLETKVVVELDVEHSRRLVSNISDKSKETLKRFALEGSVPLDELVGPGCAYSDMTDLKRSFVGAVNRRLRTVTRNRFAALFKRSRRDHRRIEVKGRTAWSLREAMGLPEPLPAMIAHLVKDNEVVDVPQDAPDGITQAAASLESRIEHAWKDGPNVRAKLAKAGSDPLRSLAAYLAEEGFDVVPVLAPDWDEENLKGKPLGRPYLGFSLARNRQLDEQALEIAAMGETIGLGVRDPAFPEVVVTCSIKERN